MRNRELRILGYAILATLVLLACDTRDIRAQGSVCCNTTVRAGSPGGINPSATVGTTTPYWLTTNYTVYWCNCGSTSSPYSIDEQGQETIGQDCPEGGACSVTTDNDPTICSPTFGTPTSTPTTWSVSTTPYQVAASEQSCVDGEEGEIGYCNKPYWEVLTCVAQAQNYHSYSEPSNPSPTTCSLAMNVHKSNDILAALRSKADSPHEVGAVSTNVRYHCAIPSANTVRSTSFSSKVWECHTDGLAFSASVTSRTDASVFGHTPLHR